MLPWLAKAPSDFRTRVRSLADKSTPIERLGELERIASYDFDVPQCRILAAAIADTTGSLQPAELDAAGYTRASIRILTEYTVDHLVAPIIIAGIRRKLLFDINVGTYGQLHQALLAPDDSQKFNFVLFALDVERRLATAKFDNDVDAARTRMQRDLAEITDLAQRAAERWDATVVVHNFPSLHGGVFGNHEAVIGGGSTACARLLNDAMLAQARKGAFLLWDIDAIASEIGRDQLIDIRMWRHAKMLIAPDAAPLAADRLAALLGAALGRSKKVLVLDLDNTIWGGVIGDDGIEGIELGQGSGAGESYLAFQNYVRALRNRGVLIAVASKNTETVCVAAIREHPEMALKMEDFACFRANWGNKADNLIAIARELNVGLDSFVFFDDSSVERELIKRELPMVAVPEVPDDPALYIERLARAHYFEAISLSKDDLQRQRQYQDNAKRNQELTQVRDMSEFLRSLDMKTRIRSYHSDDLIRVTQLINKTNQFNLTTKRYTEAAVRALGENPKNIVLSARVEDRFGDNGLISVVIATPTAGDKGYMIDSWLMSCRVLGRNVEQTVMKSLVRIARDRGADFILGYYAPTPKNGLVENFFLDQGFIAYQKSEESPHNSTWWRLDFNTYCEPPTFGELEMTI